MRAESVFVVAACCAFTSLAHAEFIGVEMREDKNLDPADVAAADPEGLGLRVFNIYAKFDEQVVEDVNDPASVNTVISLGQTIDQGHLQLHMTDRPGALQPVFYQNAGGGNLPPNSALVDLVPGLPLDTYVGLGNKTNLNGVTDTTGTDPDFDFTSFELFGGWFNSGGGNFQGGANASTFNSEKGTWDVFVMQLAVLGLDPGADAGDGYDNGNASTIWKNEILFGSITVFTQTQGGGATSNTVTFLVPPAPGSIAAFAIAGAAGSRRRRSA